jgi:hypothetical protein
LIAEVIAANLSSLFMEDMTENEGN